MTALTRVLNAVAGEVIAAAGELNRLDGVAGDGDLGVTMTAAAQALQALLPELAGQDLPTTLRRCGAELARKAPSTSGTLVATGFLRAARAAADAQGSTQAASQEGASQDQGAPAGEASQVALLAQLLAAAQQGIQERGKAAPGDKTMLDALAPAVAALQAAAGNGAPGDSSGNPLEGSQGTPPEKPPEGPSGEGVTLAVALQRAAAAAAAGATATMTMRAKVGRAGWLADRSAGHVDAGARLVALAFAAAARALSTCS